MADLVNDKSTRGPAIYVSGLTINSIGKIGAMCDLVALLIQCQHDTLEILGTGAAGRLAYWESYRDDHDRLVKFVQDRIHSDTWENGATLERNGRLSLERIVVQCGPETFTPSDIDRAAETLKMAPFAAEFKRLRC